MKSLSSCFVLVLILSLPLTASSQEPTGRKPSAEVLTVDDFEATKQQKKSKPKAPAAPKKKQEKKPASPTRSTNSTMEVVEAKSHMPGETWREPITGMEFVWVSRGCYEMGCGWWSNDCGSDETPVHEVCVSGFWMGKFEVSQGEWQKVMGNNPSAFKKGPRYPVENVSWNDAQDFIRVLRRENGGKYNFRLPTEAEWEYACRSGGKKENYSGGNSLDQVAWYLSNSLAGTSPVGTKAANGLGLHDMSGNVFEWVEDLYDESAYSKHLKQNPSIEESESASHIRRGGSWSNLSVSNRCAYRYILDPLVRFSDGGFRLVRKD